MMERQHILATMGELKLFGMKAAYDEIIKVAVKRTHEPQQIVGDLLLSTGTEVWFFVISCGGDQTGWRTR